MWTWIVEFQRDIYLAFADHIKAFAAGTGWTAFLAFLPMGVVFGAVHAMTPGHSKTVLATYLAGSSSGMWRALLVSLALSFTHVTMSVLIVLLSLPLVSVMFGGSGPGSSPILEMASRVCWVLSGHGCSGGHCFGATTSTTRARVSRSG